LRAIHVYYFDDRLAQYPNIRLLRKMSRGQFPHSTNICVDEHVCIGSGRILRIVCMYIYPESGIHNTSLVSAYFRLDKRECEYLEYLLLLLFTLLHYFSNG
jgi:hypothetical protein